MPNAGFQAELRKRQVVGLNAHPTSSYNNCKAE